MTDSTDNWEQLHRESRILAEAQERVFRMARDARAQESFENMRQRNRIFRGFYELQHGVLVLIGDPEVAKVTRLDLN